MLKLFVQSFKTFFNFFSGTFLHLCQFYAHVLLKTQFYSLSDIKYSFFLAHVGTSKKTEKT